MGTGSRSWWLVNGAGCTPMYNSSHDDPLVFPTPTSVEGCIIEYFYIEAIQASVQCLLAVSIPILFFFLWNVSLCNT